MKKILVPFDGSESSMRAVNHVADLAKESAMNEIEVHLLHVCEPLNMTTDPDYWRPEVQRSHLEKGEQSLSRAREAFKAVNITPISKVQMGYPHNDIAAYARKNGCNEIVMGSRGMSPAASFFVGSVATRVLQHVDCPVTLVK